MKILLGKVRINSRKLKALLIKITATELANIAEPCYTPPLKGPYHQLLREVNLTESDIRSFVKRLYEDHPAKSWHTHNVPATNLLVFLMNYFIRNKDKDGLLTTITYLMVRYYGNLMAKYMPKYCDEGVFRYTLDNLTKTHIFAREGTISNGIVHFAKNLRRRHIRSLAKLDPAGVAKFVSEARHRINQSSKSFARNYYKAKEAGHAIKTEVEPEEGMETIQPQVMDRGQRTIEEIIRRIVVNKTIDRKAMEDARKITKIKSSIATTIIKELTDVKYSDDIKLILTLFIRDLKEVNQLCGKGFLFYVKKLMAIKRTKAKVYFKQQVGLLLEKILTELGQKDWYDKLTPQTKFITISFLAYYMTMFMRNTLC